MSRELLRQESWNLLSLRMYGRTPQALGTWRLLDVPGNGQWWSVLPEG
jgi:hypothetical protein